MIALTIYTSAFIAEDIRSGVRSIPKEQMEAARSSGFSYLRSMQYIILPQAVRITIPPLINQFLNLTKNSSLAMTIGVMELTYQARQVESYTFKGFEAFTAATLVYLALSIIITFLVNHYNEKVLNPTRGLEMIIGLDFRSLRQLHLLHDRPLARRPAGRRGLTLYLAVISCILSFFGGLFLGLLSVSRNR